MSQKSKIRKAKREAEQEKQAKKVITWIFVALVILALAFIAVFIMTK